MTQNYNRNFEKSNEIIKKSTANKYTYKYLVEEQKRIKSSNKNNSNIKISRRISKEKSPTKSVKFNKDKNNVYNDSDKNENKKHKSSKSIDNKTISLGNLKDKNFSEKKHLSENIKIQNDMNDVVDINSTNSNNTNNSNIFNNNDSIHKSKKLIKNLSNKENAYLIISNSNCLRLCERIMFARATENLRKITTIPKILANNKYFLMEKKNEIEKKIKLCYEKLNKEFIPSKTVEMTLNFISSKIENEYKYTVFDKINDNEEKNYYYHFSELLFILVNEKFEGDSEFEIIDNLYEKINRKGYEKIKDYLYLIYIKKYKENKIIENIEKFNEIINQYPVLSDYLTSLKYCKFISYTYYLIREIIIYVKDVQDTTKLIEDSEAFLEVINKKLNLYNTHYDNKL